MLLITDDKRAYDLATGPKLLLVPFQFTTATCVEPDALKELNISLSNVEYAASDLMLAQLKDDSKFLSGEKIKCNRFLATRPPQDQLYSLLYNCYWQELLPSYALALCLRAFAAKCPALSASSVKIRISEKYKPIAGILDRAETRSFSFEFYSAWEAGDLIKAGKNMFYALAQAWRKSSFRRPRVKKEQVHLVLFLYDIPSVHATALPLIQLIRSKKNEIFLSIIEISTGVEADNRQNAQAYKDDNIDVFRFEDFRSPVRYSHSDLYLALERKAPLLFSFRKQDPLYDLELKYAWVNNIIESLKPSASLYLGVLEHGRAISDVSRFYNVPSINIEYAMFTDDPLFMESNIAFTARACISPNSSDIWRKRHDPTPEHVLTGYCKLDAIQPKTYDRKDFCTRYSLDPRAATLCFASTWSGGFEYNTLEKTIWMQWLSEVCARNQWNLVIKKHPAESDTVAEDIIALSKHPHQVVLPHKTVDVYEVIAASDLLCTQSSGIVIEGLYLNKPFCYLSVNAESNKGSINPLARETGVQTFYDVGALEKYVKELLSQGNDASNKPAFEKLKEKYLYKCDGKASARLLEMILDHARR